MCKVSNNVVIWGTGKGLLNRLKRITIDDTFIFIDRTCKKDQESFMGRPLYSPGMIKRLDYRFVLISSPKYFDEISKELIYVYGVDISKILSLDYYLECRNKTQLGSVFFGKKERFRDIYLREKTVRYTASICMGDSSCGQAIDCLDETVKAPSRVLNVGGWLLNGDDIKKHTKIYVITHKEFAVPAIEGYQAIYAGACLNRSHPYSGDDSGDHISDKNRLINECTALYWIWKNSTDDIVGTAHYRRYLESPINKGWPLQISEIHDILKNYDIIVPNIHWEGVSVVEGMKMNVCEAAYEASWEALESLFDERTSTEKKAFYDVMNGEFFFVCNLFITRKIIFDEYCEWLFPILEYLMRSISINDTWDAYSKRVIAFWAERLFSVWLLMSNYIIKELPFYLTDEGKPFGLE